MASIDENKKYNIVIVDDVVSELIYLTKIVTNAGYVARPIKHSEQLFHALESKSANMILLDVCMPNMSGFELCHLIKQKEEYKNIPILFVSGYKDSKYRLKGYEVGGEDYITKPYNEQELISKIRVHMKRSNQEVALLQQVSHLRAMLEDRTQNLQKEQYQVVRVLNGMILSCGLYAKDRMLAFQKNVRLLTKRLAYTKEYEQEIDAFYIECLPKVAPLYDIGLLKIKRSVVKKKGELTESERALYQKHTINGSHLLSSYYNKHYTNHYMELALEIVSCHHEKYDGTGYPYGLKEQDIPLAARIISVLAKYHDLRQEQWNREAYTKEEAMDLIEEEAGRSFDPVIVNVLKTIQEELEG